MPNEGMKHRMKIFWKYCRNILENPISIVLSNSMEWKLCSMAWKYSGNKSSILWKRPSFSSEQRQTNILETVEALGSSGQQFIYRLTSIMVCVCVCFYFFTISNLAATRLSSFGDSVYECECDKYDQKASIGIFLKQRLNI